MGKKKSSERVISCFVPMSQKRGQLTLFIILGIVALVAVSTYVLVFSEYAVVDVFRSDISEPHSFIEECIREDTEEVVDRFLSNNFYSQEVESNFFRYNNNEVSERIPLLCTVAEFNSPCINQEPNLQAKLKSSLEEEIKTSAQNCWEKLISSSKRSGLEVDVSELKMNLSVNREGIRINIPSDITLSSSEKTEMYSEIRVSTNIFKLASLATTITNYESTLCEFDETGWMMADNTVFITRFRAGDQTKMYTLKDRITNEEIKFAIRTCVIPVGI